MAHNLTFTIVGPDEDNGLVTIDEFARFCENMARCLRRSEGIVSENPGRIRYQIVHLECASATVTLKAVRPKNGHDDRRNVLQFFRETVTGIEKGNIDPRITPDDLQAFRELSHPLNRGAKRVRIGRSSLTKLYAENIDKILTKYFPSQGFVSGVLERLNVHNKNEFVLYPPVSGRQITCVFHKDELEKVRLAIKRQVTVHGTLFFQPDNPFPDKVHVKTIEIHPSNDELPTLHDVKKLGKWGTNDMTSVKFLRIIRSEQDA